MADDNEYALLAYVNTRLTTLWDKIHKAERRLTALESRQCAAAAPATSRPNVEPAASAGASTGLASGGSAASSAGSGGTDGCPSTSPQAPAASPAATGPVTAASASASDPVSATIRDDPNRPAWLTDEMLPLPEGTERVYRVPGGVAAYPGSFWRDESWRAGFSWVASGANAERSNQEEAIATVYHVPPPAPVAKAEPAGETAWECPKAHLSADMQPSDVAGDSPWCRFWSRYKDRYTIAEFNRFIAAEVAAAKAKPHAETAEEVAWRTARDVLDAAFNCNGQGYGNMLDKLTPIITAAIKRERGEA